MSRIPVNRRAYYGTGGFLVLSVCIGLVAFLTLSGQGGRPPEPLVINGIPRSELEQANIFLTVSERKTPDISPENAMAAVKALNIGEPDSAVLADYKDPDAKPPDDKRLAWVVVMDPATVPLPNKGTDYVDYFIHFVDANTGEWFFAFGGAASCTQTAETMAECERLGIKPSVPTYPEETQFTP